MMKIKKKITLKVQFMKIKAFQSTANGEIPLTKMYSITNGQKLKLVLFTEETDFSHQNITHIEILNPLDQRVILGKIPKLTDATIASLEVIIPDSWIGGRYIATVINLEKKSVCSCSFILKPKNSLINYLTEKSIRPNWLLHYKLYIHNRTSKPIGNFSSYIALPMNIQPFQIVKELTINPRTLKLSSDLEGNQWVHYENKRIDPGEKIEIGYTSKIQSNPLLISRLLHVKENSNPYSAEFIEPYLKPEPHIESNHIEIIKLASTIKTSNPLDYAKRAIRVVNRTLKYKIQPKELGAAFAIENKEGDCTEYAALFVALCRTKGIPARTNAGFILADNNWERHATAEFMLNGKWMPVDVTGQSINEVFIGHLPNNIILTRGNWMGGTLAQEISYRYQIIDQSQKLDVNADWKIIMVKKDSKISDHSSEKISKKKVKIISPKITTTNKIRILSEKVASKGSMHFSQKHNYRLDNDPIVMDKSKNKKTTISFSYSIPDVLKKGIIKNKRITISNNSSELINGAFIIQSNNDGIYRIHYIKPLKLEPALEKIIAPHIDLSGNSIIQLQFVFINRIGRELKRETIKTSIY
ncbi:MAG: transglutaminase domain-containing protein [Promethearchaeota archaeon]|nr:MAG: transglutaminase domain-containing protein [Candidatus Lokiarchaeota archaeon]